MTTYYKQMISHTMIINMKIFLENLRGIKESINYKVSAFFSLNVQTQPSLR